jgi:hypothetical protein
MELPAPAQAPATMNIAERLHEWQGKAIAGHLTREEMNASNVLKSGMSGSGLASDPSSSLTDTLGTRGFNLCGWAHRPPTELHISISATTAAGSISPKHETKKNKKAVTDTYFVEPLVRKNGRFRQILTTEFRDLIINWRLAPLNFEGSKPNGVLGPLSFVTCTLAEQENLEFHCMLNSLADKPTPADIEKTIPGTPEIPEIANALITLLVQNQLALLQIIGDRAPPPREIQCLIVL